MDATVSTDLLSPVFGRRTSGKQLEPSSNREGGANTATLVYSEEDNKAMRAILIRHGESTANVGVPCDDHAQIALTNRGHAQAVALAEGWSERPSLIALSPYLRTHLTAAPTMQRFPDVPVEVLPMQEFTYLEPARWDGTSRDQRFPDIDAYWSAGDPSYCDGPGAESFSTLLRRVQITLEKLEGLAQGGVAFAFTHGHFMQAVRASLLFPGSSDKEKMEYVRTWANQQPILNAEMIAIATTRGGDWAIQKDSAFGLNHKSQRDERK